MTKKQRAANFIYEALMDGKLMPEIRLELASVFGYTEDSTVQNCLHHAYERIEREHKSKEKDCADLHINRYEDIFRRNKRVLGTMGDSFDYQKYKKYSITLESCMTAMKNKEALLGLRDENAAFILSQNRLIMEGDYSGAGSFKRLSTCLDKIEDIDDLMFMKAFLDKTRRVEVEGIYRTVKLEKTDETHDVSYVDMTYENEKDDIPENVVKKFEEEIVEEENEAPIDIDVLNAITKQIKDKGKEQLLSLLKTK